MSCTAATTKPVDQGTIDDLHAHLQAAANLELWTIPLYLTALYSIKSDGSSVPLTPLGGGKTSTVTALYASVALQEMYHLELAGNMCRAFGVTPELSWPEYQGTIPYISKVPEDKVVKLGTATDPEVIELVIAVETPDTISTEPNIQYDAGGSPCYDSIGDLYSVVKQLVDKFKDQTPFDVAHQFSNGLFDSWYPHAGKVTTANIDTAIETIVEQGEGAVGDQSAPLPADDQPVTTTYPHPWLVEDGLSHVERFTLIQGHTSDVETWPTSGGASTEQAHLSAVFAKLLSNLKAGWTSGSMDFGPMMLMRSAITQVYRAGAVPSFAPSDDSGYAAAVAALAPSSGATWDGEVQYYFTLTDVGAMNDEGLDLGDENTVHSDAQGLSGALSGGWMPPGNKWPGDLVTSLTNWQKAPSGDAAEREHQPL